MPITSWSEAGQFFKRQIPDIFIKRRFNFITIHYMYMIGMSFFFSVILYVMGGMAYIDALFFASGSCTQSGLNTIDINLLRLGQQIALYLPAMFCNPIVIHSTVVFVRLYWFEKRFKDVVREARSLRRTKSRSRNNTLAKDDVENGPAQTSVRGKVIEILRNTGKIVERNNIDEKLAKAENGNSASSSANTKRTSDDSSDDQPSRNYGKAGLPESVNTEDMRLPHQLSTDQHIHFLEKQRNPADDITLRIPSPREFDRGGRPQDVGHGNDDALGRQVTTSPVERRGRRNSGGSVRQTAAQMGNHITIDEPQVPRPHEKTSNFPRINQRHGTHNSHLDASKPLTPTKSRTSTFNTFHRSNTNRTMETTPYLSYEPTIGRNSFFVNLTEEQREELGGIEYRALKTLAMVLVIYFVAFHLLGMVCLVPWIMNSATYGPVVTKQGVGRPWWGIFTAASAFNDLGFTLTNDSMIEFGTAVFPVLLTTFLIVFGNTGFPCMLRFVIWISSKCVPRGSGIWEEFQFLLDHPRRCFTLLFPRAATWWLFAVLVILNGLDLMFFVVLDLHDPIITRMSPFIRFIDGLFQASSTRTAGFGIVNLADLHPAIQVSYLIMMYISVFPIAISMRRTNVYEERSLGIYGSSGDDDNEKDPSYVGAHLRKQLSFDLWYVFLGLFIIAIAEGSRLQNRADYAFSLFAVLFEIVSAYGTVGLSLGYPTINASFSAEFSVLSKLVIIAMQIRGRHRGLPYELDRAILLPSESLHEKDEREGQRLMNRRRSSIAASAVDETLQAQRFRAETGLTSGFDPGYNPDVGRQRANTTKTQADFGSLAEHHQSHVRSGLGIGMFKLSSAPDAVRDLIHGHEI